MIAATLYIAPWLRPFEKAIRWLVASRGITKAWTRDPSFDIVLDLDAGTFCGVRWGEPIENLSRLGKCDEYSEMIMEYRGEDGCKLPGSGEVARSLSYKSQGFNVSYSDGVLDSIMIYASTLDGEVSPYPHRIRRFGTESALPGNLDAESFIRLFGTPDEINEPREKPAINSDDEDDSQFWSPIPKTFMYHLENAWFMVLFDEYDRVSVLSAASPKKRDVAATK